MQCFFTLPLVKIAKLNCEISCQAILAGWTQVAADARRNMTLYVSKTNLGMHVCTITSQCSSSCCLFLGQPEVFISLASRRFDGKLPWRFQRQQHYEKTV